MRLYQIAPDSIEYHIRCRCNEILIFPVTASSLLFTGAKQFPNGEIGMSFEAGED
jgi:hypothetical protein